MSFDIFSHLLWFVSLSSIATPREANPDDFIVSLNVQVTAQQ